MTDFNPYATPVSPRFSTRYRSVLPGTTTFGLTSMKTPQADPNRSSPRSPIPAGEPASAVAVELQQAATRQTASSDMFTDRLVRRPAPPRAVDHGAPDGLECATGQKQNADG